MNSIIHGKEGEIHAILSSPMRESLDSWKNQFTPIQHEIMKLAAEGRTSREIAEALQIELFEVNHQGTSVKRKIREFERGIKKVV
jgi:DNA-binding NarL/FixJ family response regulator